MSKFFKVIKLFLNKFNNEGIFKESAALTFVTLLGFVPFLIFILFLLPELPFLKIQDQFKDFLITVFLPSSAEQISEYIAQIVSKKIPFNLFNFIILIITSYSLFKIINDSFDHILNVHELRKQDFLTNIVKFLGMVIFGGLLILILFSATSIPLVTRFISIPLLQGFSLYFTPFVLLFIIFTLGFIYIPTIKVKLKSIIIGSASSAIVWIVFKSLFNWYIATLTNIEVIFGVLASVPIFLFWIYANWIIILSGVIIVSILEKRTGRRKAYKNGDKVVKVTFEKVIGKNSYEHISGTTLAPEQMKEILQDILNEKTKPKKEKT